jgi:hypothetical protein
MVIAHLGECTVAQISNLLYRSASSLLTFRSVLGQSFLHAAAQAE